MVEHLLRQGRLRLLLVGGAVAVLLVIAGIVVLQDRDDDEVALSTATATSVLNPTEPVRESAVPAASQTPEATAAPAQITRAPDPSIPVPPAGSLYLVDRGTNQVRVFSPDGEALFSWGAPPDGAVTFDTPAQLSVTAAGEILLLELETGDVIRMGDDGRTLVSEFSSLVEQAVIEDGVDITSTSSGDIFVLDQGASRVLSYSAGGEYQFAWGQPGSAAGFFDSPRQIFANGDEVLVLERSGRIQAFDDFGRLTESIEPDTGAIVQATGAAPLGEDQFAVIDAGASLIKVINSSGEVDQTLELDADVTPAAIAVANGRIFLLDAVGNRVLRATENDRFAPIYEDHDAQFIDFATESTGALLLVDQREPRLVRISTEGELLAEIRTAGSEPGLFAAPWGIAVGMEGDVYVSDLALDRIQRFGPTGNLLGQWGGNGSAPGELIQPRGLAVDSDGAVYVADSGNDRVQKFDAAGWFVTSWGEPDDQWDFEDPYDVALADDGSLYVADTGNDRIQRIQEPDQPARIYGSFGFANGFFRRPIAVDVHDAASRIYIADSGNRRIQMLTTDGEYAGQWGSAPTTADLVVTRGDRLLVVSGERDPRNRLRRYDIDGNFLIIRDRLVLDEVLIEPISLAVAPG